MTKAAYELSDRQGTGSGDNGSASLLREIQSLRKDSNGSDGSNSAKDLAAVNSQLHKMGLLPSLSIDDDKGHEHHGNDEHNNRENHGDAKSHHHKDSSEHKDHSGEHRDHGEHHHRGGHHNSSIDSLSQQIKQLDTDVTSHNQAQLTRDVHHFNEFLHSLGLPQGFDLEISDSKPAGSITSGSGTTITDSGATSGGNSPVEVQPTNPVLDNPGTPSTPVAPVETTPPTVSSGDTNPQPISGLPSDGSLSAAVGNAKSENLNSGIYSFNNFNQSTHAGENLPASVHFNGSGIDKTVIEMNKDTSTRAGEVPTTEGTTTNPLYLMRVAGGSPVLSNFTLAGTAQGHLYNGLRMDSTSNAVVKDVKVTGIPGNSDVNPGETFGINDFHGNNDYYSGVQIDGEGVGASGFASNGSKNVTIDGSTLTNNKYSAGATFWETQNVTVENTSTSNNRTGLNFERVSGTVNIDNVSFSGNTSHDISVNNDQGSAKVIIENPHLEPGKKLTIYVGKNEQGNPNLQKRSDIEVIENGKDVTNQVVEWV